MKPVWTSVDEYISGKPEGVRPILEAVRSTIRKALPKSEEGISYGMPVYRLKGVMVLYFASWKKHFSVYPAVKSTDPKLSEDLARHLRSKGTLVFPYTEPVPFRLIAQVAKLRAEEALKSVAGPAPASKKPVKRRTAP